MVTRNALNRKQILVNYDELLSKPVYTGQFRFLRQWTVMETSIYWTQQRRLSPEKILLGLGKYQFFSYFIKVLKPDKKEMMSHESILLTSFY